MSTDIPSRLNDVELVDEVKRLANCERESTARLVAHLAELDARRLYLGAGFSSLFTYCCQTLGLSEHETYNRIEAARAARKFPVIIDLLGQASLNLTTVRLLAPHLTDDNHRQLLFAASGKSKLEVEELVARHFPRPDAPFMVRKLSPARPTLTTPATLVTAATASARSAPEPDQGSAIGVTCPTSALPTAPSQPPAAAVAPVPFRRAVVAPLAADRYQIKFTANAKTCEKLRLARDLLRHAVPNGDTGEIVSRALTALLEDLARKKFAATERPGAIQSAAQGSRHIPAPVKRAVWLRDAARCAFVGKSGRRCDELGFLEFHHVRPYAAGGEATVANIQLRCRAHNAYEAALYYGPCRPLAEGGGGESVARYSHVPNQVTRSGTT